GSGQFLRLRGGRAGVVKTVNQQNGWPYARYCARTLPKIQPVHHIRIKHAAGHPSMAESRTESPQVQEHPLWSTLGSTLDGYETIARVPTHALPVCVCDNTPATDLVGCAQADVECF